MMATFKEGTQVKVIYGGSVGKVGTLRTFDDESEMWNVEFTNGTITLYEAEELIPLPVAQTFAIGDRVVRKEDADFENVGTVVAIGFNDYDYGVQFYDNSRHIFSFWQHEIQRVIVAPVASDTEQSLEASAREAYKGALGEPSRNPELYDQFLATAMERIRERQNTLTNFPRPSNLSDADIAAIKRRLATGNYLLESLADEFGVGIGAIYSIVRLKSHRNIASELNQAIYANRPEWRRRLRDVRIRRRVRRGKSRKEIADAEKIDESAIRYILKKQDATCERCGKAFAPHIHNQKFCSEKCKQAAENRRWYERNREKRIQQIMERRKQK